MSSPTLGEQLKDDCEADFFTTDYRELLDRPEVNAMIIATDENLHFDADHGRRSSAATTLFIEKPLATDARESRKILDAIEAAASTAVVGYTQRFRRRFLAIKERLIDRPDRRGALGRHPRLHEPDGADRHRRAAPRTART